MKRTETTLLVYNFAGRILHDTEAIAFQIDWQGVHNLGREKEYKRIYIKTVWAQDNRTEPIPTGDLVEGYIAKNYDDYKKWLRTQGAHNTGRRRLLDILDWVRNFVTEPEIRF
jgi:hypothetical protein